VKTDTISQNKWNDMENSKSKQNKHVQ